MTLKIYVLTWDSHKKFGCVLLPEVGIVFCLFFFLGRSNCTHTGILHRLFYGYAGQPVLLLEVCKLFFVGCRGGGASVFLQEI